MSSPPYAQALILPTQISTEAEKNRANCDGCENQWDNEQSASAGSFPPSPFGLHDTAGNVWEWTCTAWREGFDGSEQQCAQEKDTVAWVVRGGSWYFKPGLARSAARYDYLPDSRLDLVGFRVLCSSPIG
jgi:formylglycine-generating enzyme required for sulfatase activity